MKAHTMEVKRRPFDGVTVKVTSSLDIPRNVKFIALGHLTMFAIFFTFQVSALFLYRVGRQHSVKSFTAHPLTLSPPIPLRLYTLPYWSNTPFLIFDIRAKRKGRRGSIKREGREEGSQIGQRKMGWVCSMGKLIGLPRPPSWSWGPCFMKCGYPKYCWLAACLL